MVMSMVTKALLRLLTGGKKREHDAKASQRRYPRLRAFNLIKFTLADGTQIESISNIVDISENGLKFTCYEHLQEGSSLKMMIAIPEKNREIALDARLVWVKKMKDVKGVYVAGVSFSHISDENRELIRNLVISKGLHRSRRR